MSFIKKFVVQKFIGIVAAWLLVTSCENPVQAGLGSKVDIYGPVVEIKSPAQNSFIRGATTFRVEASDDGEVASVFIDYFPEDDKHREARAENWARAFTFNPESGYWEFPLSLPSDPADPHYFSDGAFIVRVKAVDNSGKSTVSKEYVYTVKNGPPSIEVQIPAPETMQLVTGGSIIGIATDLQAVAAGFPQIQMWRTGDKDLDPETDPWTPMDVPSYASWQVDPAAPDPENPKPGKKALEFRFRATARETELPYADTGASLPPGKYRFRLKVQDVAGTSALYPLTSESPLGYYELELISALEFPKISLSSLDAEGKVLSNPYQKDRFSIQADISHSTGLYSTDLYVNGNTRIEWKDRIPLKDDGSPLGELSESKERTHEKWRYSSHPIIPGQAYEGGVKIYKEGTDGSEGIWEEQPAGTYIFEDGTYEFLIKALSNQSSEAEQTYTAYLDTTRPEISITRVQPSIAANTIDNIYTGNGKIAVEISTYDANGIGIDGGGRRKLKYLITLDSPYNTGDIPPEKLYDINQAGYFDHFPSGGKENKGVSVKKDAPNVIMVDTTLLDSRETYDFYLYVITQDKAGNADYRPLLFKVDQKTDIPQITFSDIDSTIRDEAKLPQTRNVLGATNTRIRGTLEDDDAIDLKALKFFIRKEKDEEFKEIVRDFSDKVSNNGRTVAFEYTNEDLGKAFGLSRLTERDGNGVYYFYMSVSDNGADGEPKTLSTRKKIGDTGTFTDIVFAEDTQSPILEIRSPQRNSYVSERPYLIGTASDANGPVKVQVMDPVLKEYKNVHYCKPDGTDAKLFNWNHTYSTVTHDGYSIKLRALDRFNNVTEYDLVVKYDVSPPEIHISDPDDGAVFGDQGLFRGTARDKTGKGDSSEYNGRISGVSYTISGYGELPGNTWTPANIPLPQDPYNWTAPLDLRKETGIGEGRYSFYVKSKDEASLESTAPARRDFWVDRTNPVLKEERIADIAKVSAETAAAAVAVKGSFALGGTASDTHGLKSLTITQQKGSSGAVSLHTVNYPEGTKDTSWELKDLPRDPNDISKTIDDEDVYFYTIILTDLAGKQTVLTRSLTIDKTAPTVSIGQPAVGTGYITGSTYTIMGSAGDPIPAAGQASGVKEVSYQIGAYGAQPQADKWLAADGTTTWAKNISLPGQDGIGEGQKTLYVRAYDMVENLTATATSRNFWVDFNPPVVTETKFNDNPSLNAEFVEPGLSGFILEGSISDTNLLAAVPLDISQRKNGGNPVNLTNVTISGTGNTRNWSITGLPRNADGSSYDNTAAADGTYIYTITVSDVVGRTTSIQRTIKVDKAKPEVIINEPAVDGKSWFQDGVGNFRGSASDTSPGIVTSLFYWIAPDATIGLPLHASIHDLDHPGSEWTGLYSPFNNWNIPNISLGTVQGLRKIALVAVDGAGHLSDPVIRTFWVDTASPDLKENAIGTENEKLVTKKFMLAGTALDTNGLKSLEITQQIGNGALEPIVVSGWDDLQANPLSSNAWTLDNLPRKPGETGTYYGVSGTYKYTIKATDIAGRIKELERTVTVDNDPPTLSITSAAPAGGYIDSTRTILGESADNNRVSQVLYWIGKDTDPIPDYTTTAGLAKWKNATGDTNWSMAIDFTSVIDNIGGEGPKRLVAIAQDVAGNFSPPAAFPSDKTAYPAGTYLFIADKDAPTVEDTIVYKSSDATKASVDISNAAFSMEGKIEDTYGLQNLTIKQKKDAGEEKTVFSNAYTGTSDTWSLMDLPRDPAAVDPKDPASGPYLTPGAGGASGVYTYTITVEDLAGRTCVLTQKVILDVDNPELQITTFPSAGFISGDTTIYGTAGDNAPGSVKEIKYKLGDDAGTDPGPDDSSLVPATGDKNWNVAIKMANLGGEGAKRIWLYAYDAAGNPSGLVTRSFQVDKFDPVLEETEIGISGAAAATKNINDYFTLKGTAFDTNRITSLKIEQKQGANEELVVISPLAWQTLSVPFSNNEWTLPADSLPRKPDAADPRDPASVLDNASIDGIFTYIITLTDAANKKTVKTRTVVVDRNGPELTIVSPGADSWLDGNTMPISGRAKDVEDVSLINQVRYKVTGSAAPDNPGSGDPAAYYEDSANGWLLAEGTTNWAEDSVSLGSLAEGALYFHAVAQDKAANWGSVKTVKFYLDKNPPKIEPFEFTGAHNTPTGTTYVNGNFSFKFDVEDTNQLQGVKVIRDGTDIVYPNNGVLSNWKDNTAGVGNTPVNLTGQQSKSIIDIPLQTVPGLSSGEHNYVITVYDIVGKTTVLEKRVIVDTTPPTAEFTRVIPMVGEKINGVTEFSVAASDGNGLLGVKWFLLSSTDPAPNYDDAGGTLFNEDNTLNMDTLEESSPSVRKYSDGDYTFYIIARDRAKNDSIITDKITKRNITIDQDSDKPVVTITNPSQGLVVGKGYKVIGTVTDDDGVDGSSIKLEYETSSGVWSSPVDVTVTGSGKEYSFSYTLPDSFTDGEKKIRVSARDLPSAKIGADKSKSAISGVSDVRTFKLDKTPPVLALAAAFTTGEQTYRTAFNLSGTVTELNLSKSEGLNLSRIQISVDGGSYSDILVAGTNPDHTWSYDGFNAAFFADSSKAGRHSLVLLATDEVNQTAILSWEFYADGTGPEISLTTVDKQEIILDSNGDPDPDDKKATGIITASVPVLAGQFSDLFSSVFFGTLPADRKFQYQFDRADDAADDWKDSPASYLGAGTKIVSWKIPLRPGLAGPHTDLADGFHYVEIKVQDRLGNETRSERLGFRIDTAAPELVITTPQNPLYGTIPGADNDTVFTLTGTVTEANPDKFTVRLGSGADINIFSNIAGDGTFSFPVSKAQLDVLAAADGTKTITFTATDAVPRETTVEWRFISDRTAPAASFSNIVSAGTTVLEGSSPQIYGSADDLNGVKKIESRIEKWDYTLNSGAGDWSAALVQEWTDVVDDPSGTTVPWTKPLTSGGLNLSDGKYRISLRVTDSALPNGNVYTGSAVSFFLDRAAPTLSAATKNYYNEGEGNPKALVFNIQASDFNTITGVRGKLDTGAYITASAGSPGTYTLTIPSTGISEGDHTLTLEATDGAGKETIVTKSFIYDNKAPTGEVTEPVSQDTDKEAFVSGSVKVKIITSDENAVKAVFYSLGKADVEAGIYVPAVTDALNPESFNTRYAGKASIAGASLYSPSMIIEDPIGSFVKVGGTAINPDLTYVTLVPESDAEKPEVYALPLGIKIEDVAGNKRVLTHILWLDPNGDLPTVVINYPDKNSVTGGDIRIVGGEISVHGTATDNEWMHDVVIRVLDISSGLPGTPVVISGPKIVADAETNSKLSQTGWMKHKDIDYNQGSKSSWAFDINSNGELNPLTGGTDRHIQIEVMAYDADTTDISKRKYSGPINKRVVRFQNGVPEISNITISNTFLGTVAIETVPKIAGEFTLRADIRDDTGLEFINWHGEENGAFVEILGIADSAPAHAEPKNLISAGGTLTAGQTYLIYEAHAAFEAFGVSSANVKKGYEFTATTGGTLTDGKAIAKTGGFYEYTLSIKLDSSTLWNNKFAGKSGTYTISLQAKDYIRPNPFQATVSVQLQIDNFYPLGNFEGDGNATGTNYNIQGTAWDTGADAPVQGLSKVVAYFSRVSGVTRTYIHPQELKFEGGQWVDTGKTCQQTTITAMKGRTESAPGTLESVIFPVGDSGIMIDRNEPSSDSDNDGYLEGFADNGPNKEWYATYNTFQLKDGPVTLHFVVFDSAGNASYYEQELVIKNHPPLIQSITLGTDLAGRDNINGERKTVTINYPDSQFIVRNKQLEFEIKVNGGKYPLHYRLQYVNTTQEKAVSELVAGNIYTIKELGTTIWTSVGAPEIHGVGTPFMATGSSDFGGGKVLAYSGPGGLARSVDISSNDGATVKFSYSGADFGTGTGAIKDTTVANGAHFILKVFDTLNPAKPEAEQLADFAFIGIDVKNTDTVQPSIYFYDLNPHAAPGDIPTAVPTAIGNNRDMGGIYTTGSGKNAKRSGHIEPREGNGAAYSASNSTRSYFLQTGTSNFARDTLSGKVILRGYAKDDQRIKEIKLTIGGDTEFSILVEDTAAGENKGLLKAAVAGAYVFNKLDLAGHEVEWAYVWDTEAKPANIVVGDNVTVKVKAEDYRSTPNVNNNVVQGDGSGATSNRFYTEFKADLRPYITGIERDTGKGYSSLRSRHGWYTFSREETIKVNGFNLKDSGNTTITLKTMENGGTGGSANAAGTGTSNVITFTVPANASSGDLILKAGGTIEAVNNNNIDTHPWARETFTNEAGNSLWNDTRKVHVWQSDETHTGSSNYGYFVGSDRPIDPSMTIDPSNARLWGAWADFAQQAAYYGHNEATNSKTPILDNVGGGGQDHTDIYIAKNRRTVGNVAQQSLPTVVYHDTFSYAGTYDHNNSGGVYIHDPHGSTDFAYGTTTNDTVYGAELVYHNEIIDQFTNMRIVTNNNDMHVSYYDTKDGSMKYWWGASNVKFSSANYNTNALTSSIAARRWINIDGGSDADDDFSRRGRPNTNGETRSTNAGEWSAIDLRDDNGLKKPVIAYFDDENQTVRLAWSSVVDAGRYKADGGTPVAGTAGNPYRENSPAGGEKWTVQYAMNSSDPNYSFSGNYISMRIDKSNNAHLAFLNTRDSTLIYLKLEWISETAGYQKGTSVVVDELGEGANWIDLSLDKDDRPWISYLKDKKNFYDVMKMAYLDTSLFSTGWEIMSVPARYYAMDSRTSIENWPSRDTDGLPVTRFWAAAIGYKSNDYYRIAYYTKPVN
jgi:hypothetical protein